MKQLFAALLAGLLLAGCTARPGTASTAEAARPAGSAQVISLVDDLGRTVNVEAPPRRVAALIGSFADVWCLAGGEDSLVASATDAWTYFDWLPLEGVTDLGATKQISLETLIAAEPDLVIASSNTTSNVELLPALEELGVPTAYFSVNSFDDYLHMLYVCTELTGRPENYQACGLDVQNQVDEARARSDGSAPTVLLLRSASTSCKVKNSQGTVLGEILADLGAVNIADQDESLLEDLSLERILADDPDYIFVVFQGSDEAAAQKTLEAALTSNPAWDTLTAVQEGRFYLMEKELFHLKPNARWGEAYEKVADILYPAV